MRGAPPLAGVLPLALLLATATSAAAQDVRRAAPLRVVDHGPIPRAVRESSGLAVSRAHPGIFWTHNDSGDDPMLYALDSTAALVATVRVRDVAARDWEDLDIGPCPGADAAPWCLYVADTGDNQRRRESVAVHVVPEPSPRTDRAVRPLTSIRFRYEGGPFDVEAVAVTPAGDVVLATKGREPPLRVFRIAAAEVSRPRADGDVLTLSDPVALPLEPQLRIGRALTGGTFGPAGSVLALRTYTAVYFYAWPFTGPPAEAAPVCELGLLEPIGEAIAFARDGRMFLASESPRGRIGHLLEVECAGLRDRPEAPER